MSGEMTPDKRRVAAAAAAYVQKMSFVDVMREKADKYALFGLLESARFLADKASSASNAAADDALRLARVHHASQQYRRALHVLTAADLPSTSLPARLLAAQCTFELGDLDECLLILGETDAEPIRELAVSENEPPIFRRRPNQSPQPGGAAYKQAPNSGPSAQPPKSPAVTGAWVNTPEVRAALCVLRGRVFEELENTDRAAWWYKRALVWDVYCCEAFVRLEDSGLISPEEGAQFANELLVGRGGNASLWNVTSAADVTASSPPASPAAGNRMSLRRIGGVRQPAAEQSPIFSPSKTPAPDKTQSSQQLFQQSDAHSWVCAYYKIRVDRSGPLPGVSLGKEPHAVPALPLGENATTREASPMRTPSGQASVGGATPRSAVGIITADRRMADNIDVLAVRALRLFHTLDFEECARLTRIILDRDPFVEERFTLVHLASLVELDERHELFVTAHTLVDNSPREAISWMAVGYYYFACGKFELARRYLQKATGISPRLGPAWIAFGHAFAAQDESDQAMAAYRTASRLYPGSLIPPLFMGMEYARQSSLIHATSFFHSAREACPSDPAPRHELGVVAYRSGDIQGAVTYFNAALSLWEKSDLQKGTSGRGGRRSEAEEATLFNLGHCYRRLRLFDKAKACYETALGLRPRSASTCSALGMVLHAMGDPVAAVSMYHRALRYNPEDALSVLMLNRALEDMHPV